MITVSFRPGNTATTQLGYVNKNTQKCHGTLGVPGTDNRQYAFRLECFKCGYVYGANGTDVAERLCPECQDGKPGIRYWLEVESTD